MIDCSFAQALFNLDSLEAWGHETIMLRSQLTVHKFCAAECSWSASSMKLRLGSVFMKTLEGAANQTPFALASRQHFD